MITKTAQSNSTVLQQLCKLIPLDLLQRIASEKGVDKQARAFTPMSHVAAMLFAQLARVVSLSDLRDWLQLKSGSLQRFCIHPRGKNTFAHANKNRDADFIRTLFWEVNALFARQTPAFAHGIRNKSPLHKFKCKIHAVDSTVIQLCANSIDWAKYRARKAAAKVHMRLDLRSFLPAFLVVGKGGQNDTARAEELCKGLEVIDFRLGLSEPFLVLLETDFEFTYGGKVLAELFLVVVAECLFQLLSIAHDDIQDTLTTFDLLAGRLGLLRRASDEELRVELGRGRDGRNRYTIGRPRKGLASAG